MIKITQKTKEYIKDVLFILELASSPALVVAIAIEAQKRIKEKEAFEKKFMSDI